MPFRQDEASEGVPYENGVLEGAANLDLNLVGHHEVEPRHVESETSMPACVHRRALIARS